MTQTEGNERTLGNLGPLLGPTMATEIVRPKPEQYWRDAEDYACLTCHDGGFVRHELPLGHPDFGKTTPCPACAGVVVAMGIPGYLQDASFERFNLHLNPSMGTAVTAVRKVADGAEWCALLMGDIGVGKTHLAVAALRFNTLPKPGRFWLFSDLLRWFRERMYHRDPDSRRDEDDLVQEYQHFRGLLVLDDVGAGTPDSNFTDRTLFAIVNARYAERLPTIITTNEPATLDPRVLSRCSDGAVTCEGKDLRGR